MLKKLIFITILCGYGVAYAASKGWGLLGYGGGGNPYATTKFCSLDITKKTLVSVGFNAPLYNNFTVELTGVGFLPWRVEVSHQTKGRGIQTDEVLHTKKYFTGVVDLMIKHTWPIKHLNVSVYGKAGAWFLRSIMRLEPASNPTKTEIMDGNGVVLGGGVDYIYSPKLLFGLSANYYIPLSFCFMPFSSIDKHYIKQNFFVIKAGARWVF